MSGIIQSARDERRQMMPMMQRNTLDESDEANTKAKILDLSILKELIGKVIQYHRTDVKNCDEFRKYTQIWEVNLRNILGYVDEPTWVFMIESYLQWCIECKLAVQPNGKWEVLAYEILQERKIRRTNRTVGKKANGKGETLELKTPYDVLVIGVQFVDIKNETDLAYDMGRPTTRKDSFDPKMMKQLMKNSAPQANEEQQAKIDAQEARLSEQSKLIEELKADQKRAAAEQAKNNDLLAALLNEVKEQKSSRSSTRRK